MLCKVKKFIHNSFYRPSEKEIHKVQSIASDIGFFYLEKNAGDYEKAIEEITQLGITKIDFKGTTIHITLTRPGLLIGRRGENIDKLRVHLSKSLKQEINIDIIEDRITGWLIPFEPYSDSDIDSAVDGT